MKYVAAYKNAREFLNIAPPSANPRKKKKQRQVHMDLFEMGLGGGPDDDTGSDDDDDDEEEPKTEMDVLDELRLKHKHKDIVAAHVGGRFNIIKFYSNMQRSMPIHKIMAMRVLCDQNTEGSSERSFSAHGVYATPLRHALGSKIAANMVKAKENHPLVWEGIKDKIWERYREKYREDASAFTQNEQLDHDN